MAKLWQKNYSLDLLMQHFTVRNDYILDQELLISDVVASIAHATMLNKINILSNSELEELKQGLNEIYRVYSGHGHYFGYAGQADAGKRIYSGENQGAV